MFLVDLRLNNKVVICMAPLPTNSSKCLTRKRGHWVKSEQTVRSIGLERFEKSANHTVTPYAIKFIRFQAHQMHAANLKTTKTILKFFMVFAVDCQL